MKKLFKYPAIIITTVILMTIFFAIQLPDLRISGNMANFLPENNQAVVAKEKIQQIFGSQENIVIMMKVNEGTILRTGAIKKVAGLTEALTDVPHVTEVTSLTSMDHIEGMDGGIQVEKIVDTVSGINPEDIRRKLMSWDMYEGLLYSEDFKSTQIILTLASQREGTVEAGVEETSTNLTDKEYDKSIEDIREILANNSDDNFTFMLAGEKVINQSLKSGIIRDLIILLPILIVVLVLILFIAFRTFGGIALPLLTVLISSIWTMGFMSLIGVKLSILTMVIPILLVAVGSAYGIHILSHYYDELKKEPSPGKIDEKKNRSILFSTLGKIGIPVILAGITTVAGFGSLSSSSISAMKEMGLFAAIGVLFAIIISLLFIPAVLALKRKKYSVTVKRKTGTSYRFSRFFKFLYIHVTKHNIRTLVIALVLVLVSLVGFSRVIIGQPWINFFKKNTEMFQSDRFINDNFNGTTILSILIRGNQISGPESGVLQPGDAVEELLFNDSDFDTEESGGEDSLLPGDSIKGPLFDDSDFNLDEFEGDDFQHPVNPVEDSLFDDSDFDVDELGEDDSSFSGDEPEIEQFAYNSVKTPGLLKAMDDMGEYLIKKFPEIKDVSSLATLIKQLNKVMHSDEQAYNLEAGQLSMILESILKEDSQIAGKELVRRINAEMNFEGEAYNEIPFIPGKYGKTTDNELRRLISQYLLLYSGNIGSLVDNADNPVKTLMRIQMKEAHPRFLQNVIREIETYAAKHIEPLGYSIETSGYAKEMLEMNGLIVNNQLTSIMLALGFVILVISLTNKSIIAGLFCAIPIVLTLLINFGFMGFIGYPLDVVTAMIASLAIGIGIDYSIHFLSTYKREFRVHKNHDTAALNTLKTTGKAIVFNAASVAAGFAVLLTSMLKPLNTVGSMIVLTMFASSLLAMILLPALLKTFNPAFLYETKQEEAENDNNKQDTKRSIA